MQWRRIGVVSVPESSHERTLALSPQKRHRDTVSRLFRIHGVIS
jgi:hypothetical protein